MHDGRVKRIALPMASGNNAETPTLESPMSWILDGKAASFAELVGLRGNLAADLLAFTELLWSGAAVDPVTLELCRLRVAALHGCVAELALRRAQATAAGLTEARIARLADWYRDPGYSARERACLQVAEQFVMDPAGLDDLAFAAARAELGEPGMVALLEALAVFDGFARFQVMLQAQPATAEAA
jgi:AhpD family alkylhydroperoxidase